MNREQRILFKMKSLNPIAVTLTNDSAKHAGHAQLLGPNGITGESHYRLEIESSQFIGKTRIDRQRLIMDLLKDEFLSGLHALEIKARVPGEA